MSKLIIHRGANEIGGSVLELNSGDTKILFDFGIPLEAMDCKDFSTEDYKPNIQGLYNNEAIEYSAIFLTHAHPDHYGLLELVNPQIPIYVSKTTYDILSKVTPLTTKFNTKDLNLQIIEDSIKVGDFTVKVHNVDHSIAGACAFEIQVDNKVILYTGDIRFHGRSAWKSSKLAQIVPNPGYLVMEGTTLGRVEQTVITEDDLIQQFTDVFKGEKLPIVMFSPQNLDRFITVYKACLKAKKTLVIDPYTCYLLEIYKSVSKNIPQFDWNHIAVYFAKSSITDKLAESGDLFRYKAKKVSMQEIIDEPEKYVIKGNFKIIEALLKFFRIDELQIVYSMWKGYLEKPSQIDVFKENIIHIHTSGHAYIKALQDFVKTIQPENIIPIHTEHKGKYSELFDSNIIALENGETLEL